MQKTACQDVINKMNFLFMSCHHYLERLGLVKNKNQDLKAKIYHITFKTILQHTYFNDLFVNL